MKTLAAAAAFIAIAATASAADVKGVVEGTHTGHNNFCFEVDGKAYGVYIRVPPTFANKDVNDPLIADSIDRAYQAQSVISFDLTGDRIDCLGINALRVRNLNKGTFLNVTAP